MVRIAYRGYLGKCEVCQGDLPLGPGNKKVHYMTQHPEVKFSAHRGGNGKKTLYGCGLCDKVTALSNYAAIVNHYQLWHPGVLQGEIFVQVVKAEKPQLSPQAGPSNNPVEQVDKFFEGLSALMLEVEALRKEKAEWRAVAEKWAIRIVELQELMGRKP